MVRNCFPRKKALCRGGPLSPLLANITLHGLETNIVQSFRPTRGNRIPPMVVRYADDFVVLHPDLHFIEHCAKATREWLRPLGLELEASKTRITHTLKSVDGKAGFDFLGFNIRQYKVGKTSLGSWAEENYWASRHLSSQAQKP